MEPLDDTQFAHQQEQEHQEYAQYEQSLIGQFRCKMCDKTASEYFYCAQGNSVELINEYSFNEA